MNWKRRLSEMMLAGGAVGLCVGYDEGCVTSSEGPNFCCNANGDPCCPVDYCGVPMTPACQAEKACQDAGGNYSNFECVSAGDYADATLLGYDDATMLGYDGPSSGGSSSGSPPEICCNANLDPCCPFLFCDAGLTQECQSELACLDAGRWDAWAEMCGAPSDDDAASAADASASDAAGGDDASDGDAHD
jgi:hypothetical protein